MRQRQKQHITRFQIFHRAKFQHSRATQIRMRAVDKFPCKPLRSNLSNFNVRVAQQQPILIGEAKGLRLEGQFDWRLAGDPIRVDSPFELFLQRGERGQSWRLARPIGPAASAGAVDQQTWITDPLPLKARG